MRLTKESGCFDETTIYTIVSEPSRKFFKMNECVQKLGKLEDVEEELGIDLITLFKAYHSGFYIKYKDGLEGFIHGGEYYLEVRFETKCFVVKEFEPNGTKWYFQDYGKTWALTKEELK